MKIIYLWFYCLPLWKASLLILLFTFISVYFVNKYKSKKYVKCIITLCVFVGISIVLFTTLNRDISSLDYPVTLIPFKSYVDVFNGANKELIRANFMNVLLFYPLGLFAGLLTDKKYKNILWAIAFFILSVFIEIMQYKFQLGYAEIDDVIHNTLGAAIGIWLSGFDLTRVDIKIFLRRKHK